MARNSNQILIANGTDGTMARNGTFGVSRPGEYLFILSGTVLALHVKHDVGLRLTISETDSSGGTHPVLSEATWVHFAEGGPDQYHLTVPALFSSANLEKGNYSFAVDPVGRAVPSRSDRPSQVRMDRQDSVALRMVRLRK